MASYSCTLDDAESFHYSMNPEDVRSLMEVEHGTILSVLFCEQKIGACFYRPDNGRILLFPDSEESAPNFETLEMLITQIEPSVVLLSQACSEDFKKKARALMSDHETVVAAGDRSSENATEPVPSTSAASMHRKESREDTLWNDSKVKIMATKFFSEKFSREKLMELDVPINVTHSEKMKSIFWSSVINVTNKNLVRSLAALFKFLDLRSEKIGETHSLSGFQNFFPEERVFVENTTMEALQVFKTEYHPSSYKSGLSKDGFCVFTKFNRCLTRAGAAFMRKIFRHPLTDVKVLNERFDILSLFSTLEYRDAVVNIKSHLKYIFSVHKIMQRMSVGHASITDWKVLHKTLKAAISINAIIALLPTMIEKSDLLRRFMADYENDSLKQLCDKIEATIDFRQSTKDDFFHVKRGMSEVFDMKDEIRRNLPNILINEFMNDAPFLAGYPVISASMVYIPQIGFLVKVKPLMEGTEFLINGFEFTLASDGFLYFKSETCLRLDNDIGDIECDIRDEEVAIMYALQDNVLQSVRNICDTVEKLAEIDCFIAMSEVCAENNYIRPTFNDRNEFNIVGGRHYLQESCTTNFVANDFVSGDNDGSQSRLSKVKIITGANACGKSIYLKQICLISYMAQIGCFVPARRASLPIIDKIFTRIQTVESVSTKTSSFCFDLNQVAIATRNATSRSLIALDEFGKGTSISQGVSLLAATINYWLRSCNTPHLLVSTHLLSLPKLLMSSPIIEFKTFETIIEEDNVIYTYKLKNGIAESSFGTAVARMAGLSQNIVNRAKYITETLAAGRKLSTLKNDKYDAYVARCCDVGKRFLQLPKESLTKEKLEEFIDSLSKNSVDTA